jgi:ATP-binding cassette subfamily B protein
MWRVLKLGYSHEPGMLLASFALSQLAALPDAVAAVWLKMLGEALLRGDRRLLVVMALALGLTATATWFLLTVSTRLQRRFRDKVTIALEAHVARLQAGIATIAHQERPEYLDRLSVLRDQVFVLDHMYMSLFSTCGWILRLVVVIGLLMSIHPALAVLALFALPTVFTSTWRPGVERTAEERGAPASRLARHLFATATTAAPGKEVRVTRIGERLVQDRRAAWERWYGPVAAARGTSAAWHALAWMIFGGAYVGAIVFVSQTLKAPAGDVLLVLAAGSRLSAYIGATVGEIGFLRGIWLDGSRRLAWLEDYAASVVATADQPAPERLREGIRLEGVSFAYPGTEKRVLESVDLDLPVGTVIALVGENGAGKSTLVKLLCKLYEPTAGRILVDGAPACARSPGAQAWPARSRTSSASSCPPGTRRRRDVTPSTTSRRSRRPSRVRGRRTWWPGCPRGSRPSSGRPGPAGSRSRSGSGRRSRSRGGSCASGPCCSCSTSPRPPWTRRPNMRCSSATRRRRVGRKASRSWSRIVSLPCAWPTSSSSSTAPAWPRSAPTKR